METTVERRVSARKPARVYFNKYIDGHPYLCEAVDLSSSGMLLRRVGEPDASRACYAFEMADERGGERIWLCATPVWSQGDFEAVRFVAPSDRDKALLEGLLEGLDA